MEIASSFIGIPVGDKDLNYMETLITQKNGDDYLKILSGKLKHSVTLSRISPSPSYLLILEICCFDWECIDVELRLVSDWEVFFLAVVKGNVSYKACALSWLQISIWRMQFLKTKFNDLTTTLSRNLAWSKKYFGLYFFWSIRLIYSVTGKKTIKNFEWVVHLISVILTCINQGKIFGAECPILAWTRPIKLGMLTIKWLDLQMNQIQLQKNYVEQDWSIKAIFFKIIKEMYRAFKNKGLDLANGRFHSISSADDFIHPKKFSTPNWVYKNSISQSNSLWRSADFFFESVRLKQIFSSHFMEESHLDWL